MTAASSDTHPAAARAALAVAAVPARWARTAPVDAGDQHPAGLHLGYVAPEVVQVGTADGHGVDTDDRVEVVPDRRVGNLVPRPLSRAVVDERAHSVLLAVAAMARPPTAPAGDAREDGSRAGRVVGPVVEDLRLVDSVRNGCAPGRGDRSGTAGRRSVGRS